MSNLALISISSSGDLCPCLRHARFLLVLSELFHSVALPVANVNSSSSSPTPLTPLVFRHSNIHRRGRPDAAVSAASNHLFIDHSTAIMLDYARQRPSPTIPFSVYLLGCVMCLHLCARQLHAIDTPTSERSTLRSLLQAGSGQLVQPSTRRFVRIVYFREFDMSIDESRLKSDVRNLTESYGIDFQLSIVDQSTSFSMMSLCSMIAHERRDTILIADLYTKEIDFLSRSLKLPTIAITNRYQIVQGKAVSLTGRCSLIGLRCLLAQPVSVQVNAGRDRRGQICRLHSRHTLGLHSYRYEN